MLSENRPPFAAPLRQAQVVVLEDDNFVASAIALFLHRKGYDVTCFNELSRLEAHLEPDCFVAVQVVILDLSVTKTASDIFELFRVRGYTGRFLVHSGAPSPEGLQLNPNVYATLPKPTAMSDLHSAVAQLASPRRTPASMNPFATSP